MKRFLAHACAVLTLTACGSGDGGSGGKDGFPDTIVLGAVPAENSTDLAESYDPLIKLLEKETGAKVDFNQASDYAGVIEGLIADKVDIAFLGPFGYVIATKNAAKIKPLGAVIAAKGEKPGYRSYGLAKSDNSAVNDIKDFAGKDVCFVDSSSTSGFLYPSAGLIEAGVIESSEEADLSKGLKPIFAGGHDASALAIKNGDCEAGFAFDTMVDKTLVEKGDLEKGDLKKVWESESITGSVFVARDGLGAGTIESLTRLLTEKANADHLRAQGLCDGACTITDEDAWGVAPVTDSDYDGVRKVCVTTKSDKCQ